MSMHRSLAAGLWLLAALGAYALAAFCLGDAQRGKIQPWALVAVFWGAALVSVAIHHLSRYLSDCLDGAAAAWKQHRVRLEPVARLLAGRLRRSWRRHKGAIGLDMKGLRGRLALVPDALGLRAPQYKAAALYARGLPERLVQVPRHYLARHKAAAG